jgi:exocyst complex component 5
MEEITRIKKRVQMKVEDLEDQAFAAEANNKKKLSDTSGMFEAGHKTFSSLEKRLMEVGKIAIRIGEQLESVEKQRSRAAEARDLLANFSQTKAGNFSQLDDLQYGSNEDLLKCAVAVKRLLAICRGLDMPNTAKCRLHVCGSLSFPRRQLMDSS